MANNIKIAQKTPNNLTPDQQQQFMGTVRFASEDELEIATLGNAEGVTVTPSNVYTINFNGHFSRAWFPKEKDNELTAYDSIENIMYMINEQNPKPGDIAPVWENKQSQDITWYVYCGNHYWKPLNQGPKGDQGLKGDKGDQGIQGEQGYSISGISTSSLPIPGKESTYNVHINDPDNTSIGSFDVHQGYDGLSIEKVIYGKDQTWKPEETTPTEPKAGSNIVYDIQRKTNYIDEELIDIGHFIVHNGYNGLSITKVETSTPEQEGQAGQTIQYNIYREGTYKDPQTEVNIGNFNVHNGFNGLTPQFKVYQADDTQGHHIGDLYVTYVETTQEVINSNTKEVK